MPDAESSNAPHRSRSFSSHLNWAPPAHSEPGPTGSSRQIQETGRRHAHHPERLARKETGTWEAGAGRTREQSKPGMGQGLGDWRTGWDTKTVETWEFAMKSSTHRQNIHGLKKQWSDTEEAVS